MSENNKIINGKIEEIDDFNPSSKRFYHYTKIFFLEKIFSKQQFRLNALENMNDFNDRKPNAFSLSFCSSNSESIPMWYLYGGVKGDGVRISFTAKTIEKIKNNDFYYLINDEKIFVNPKKIIFKNVLYFENHPTSDKGFRGKNLYKIKLNGNIYYVSLSQLNEFKNNNAGLYKSMEWSYEKEAKLLVDLESNVFEKIKNDGIYFSIENFKNGLSIRKGPTAPNWESKEYADLISFFGKNKKKCSDSILSNTIEMNLCRLCKNREIIK